MNFLNQNYVIIDFETANSNMDSICQIGMIKVKDGKVIDTFESYVKPQPLYFSSMNISVHGITEQAVIDKPIFKDIWPSMKNFIEEYPLVAHFAQFDMNCLQKELAKIGEEYYFEFACSCRIAKEVIPGNNHKLTYLSETITNFQYKAHDALEDCNATYELLNYCFTNYNILEIINNKYQFGVLSKTEGYVGFKYKKK